jgi:hypothetical protein
VGREERGREEGREKVRGGDGRKAVSASAVAAGLSWCSCVRLAWSDMQ